MSVIISFAAVPKEATRGSTQTGRKSYTKNLSKHLVETKNYLEEFLSHIDFTKLLQEGVILFT